MMLCDNPACWIISTFMKQRARRTDSDALNLPAGRCIRISGGCQIGQTDSFKADCDRIAAGEVVSVIVNMSRRK